MRCVPCGYEASDSEKTCPKCGEASWEKAPSAPASEPSKDAPSVKKAKG